MAQETQNPRRRSTTPSTRRTPQHTGTRQPQNTRQSATPATHRTYQRSAASPQGQNQHRQNRQSRTHAAQHAPARTSAAQHRKKKSSQPFFLVLAGILILLAIVILVNQLPDTPSDAAETSNTQATPSALQASSDAPQESDLATEPTDPADNQIGTDVLAEYSSPNYGGYNRTINLQLACQAIDGTVVQPGAVFSFNETVGERTEEKGYLPASIYAAGNTTDEVGGGICQVASTLYLVAMKSDMEIVERCCHQFTVNYLPLGMDASIYWDSDQDFKFRNTSDYPICIAASAEGGFVDISITGTKKDDTYIMMEYEILATYEPEEIEEINWLEDSDYSEVTSTPITGYYVQTYRCVYAADGTLLSRTEEAISNYFKRDKVTVVGPPDPDKRQRPTMPTDETEPDTEDTEATADPIPEPEPEPDTEPDNIPSPAPDTP